MHHSIFGKTSRSQLCYFFFNKTILGALKNCLPQNEKQGFIFFAHLKKKKQNKTTTPCCQKLAIWFSNRLQIPSKPDPPRSLHRIEGRGRGFQKRGRGDHFKTPIFGVCFFPNISKKIFPIIKQLTPTRSILSCQWVQTPLWSPPDKFRNIWTLPNFGFEESKIAVSALCCFLKTTIRDWKLKNIYIKISAKYLGHSASNIFSSIINIFSPSDYNVFQA